MEGGHRRQLWPRMVDVSLTLLIIANVAAVALGSIQSFYARWSVELRVFELMSVAVFVVEYGLRLWVAPEHLPLRQHGNAKARFRFACTPLMLVDLLAFLPSLVFYVFGGDMRIIRVLRILRLLKLVRYSPAIVTLWHVLYSERRALIAALVIMLCLLTLTAGVMYYLERDAQPEAFASIPAAMWWSLATLSTVGYGDIVPVTPLGKVFGGLVALLGIGMYGLPIAIVASGFTNEFYRRDFIITWGMVAEVPLFAKLSPSTIESVAKSLRARRVPKGFQIMQRGDLPDAFYVIIDGTVEVHMPDNTYELGPGDYFGVISMLYNIERPATATAQSDCRLMMLSKFQLDHLMTVEPELNEELHLVARNRARDGGVNLT